MTPKEKAKELVEKYYEELPSPIFNVHYDMPVNCALIAVEEIINQLDNNTYLGHPINDYWQEVKQHLKEMK